MTPARVALDAHTGLYEVLKHPPEPLVRQLDHYVIEGRKVVEQHRRIPYEGLSAEESAMLAGWEHYTWPARTGREMVGLVAGPLFSAPTYSTGDGASGISSNLSNLHSSMKDGRSVSVQKSDPQSMLVVIMSRRLTTC